MNGPRLFVLVFALAGLARGASVDPVLTLAEARERALKSHPRITTAQLRSLIAQEGVTQARAGYFPSLAANATAIWSGESVTRLGSGGISNSQIFDHSGVGATLSLLVTDFGRTSNLNAAARHRAKAASAEVLVTRAQLQLQVAAAYLDVLKARAVKGVAEKTLAMREAVFQRTQALGKNQLRSELDVRLAQVNVDEARLLIDAAEKDTQSAVTILGNLIGDPAVATRPLELPPAPPALPADVSSVTALALQQRPELTRYRAESEAAHATARAARDARRPTISVIAAAGFVPSHYPQFDNKYAAGGLNLNLPLFAGGLYTARQREAELQAEATEAALQDFSSTITRDVRLAWLDAVHARDRIALTDRLAENATAALELARARFDQGLTSTVELLQADLARTSADIAKSTADYAYRVRREILDFQSGNLH